MRGNLLQHIAHSKLARFCPLAGAFQEAPAYKRCEVRFAMEAREEAENASACRNFRNDDRRIWRGAAASPDE